MMVGPGRRSKSKEIGTRFYVKDLKRDGHWVYGQYRIGHYNIFGFFEGYTSPVIYIQSDTKDDYMSTRLGEAPTEIQVCTVYAPYESDSCSGWTKVA